MATITTNDIKFVVFGNGHDYTLNNSGTGEGARFFSHPYVPLNSVNYAGQYYFLVPDESGNLIDAVKDDVVHCTFEPAIGTAFSTEGETEVKVTYHREYIHDEETIIVHKVLTQKIEVVDHGAVVTNSGKYTAYADKYLFIHPASTTSVVADSFYRKYNATDLDINKVSSIPWRAVSLGKKVNNYDYGGLLTNCYWYDPETWEYYPLDISELQYADTSNVTTMKYMFDLQGSYILDYSALADWDVSKVTDFEEAFINYGHDDDGYVIPIDDLSFLLKWDVSSAVNMKSMIHIPVKSLHGLENWDVSNVTNITNMFYSQVLSDISALANWDVSRITDFTGVFSSCESLESLHGLELWDVSNGTDFSKMFHECGSYGRWYWNPDPGREYILDISAIADWDISNATTLYQMFYDTGLRNLSPIADWDVSNVESLIYTFSGSRISDLTPIADWDISKVKYLDSTFSGTLITDLTPLANWNVGASVISMCGTFGGCDELQTLNGLQNWDVSNVQYFNHRREGNVYYEGQLFGCLKLADISAIANWNVAHVKHFGYMFNRAFWLLNISYLNNWDFRSASGSDYPMGFMFGNKSLYYSSKLGKNLYYSNEYPDYYYYDYDGNYYNSNQVADSSHPLTQITQDASSASGWTVPSGTYKRTFPNNWSNRPSWN